MGMISNIIILLEKNRKGGIFDALFVLVLIGAILAEDKILLVFRSNRFGCFDPEYLNDGDRLLLGKLFEQLN